MHITNGILFNHESPRRGPTFVTRKVTRAVARIQKGTQDCLYLGNLDSKRDWGHARDYVECMWKMVQKDEADDFVIATGETHTVREFVEKAFEAVGTEIAWIGEGVGEIGYDKSAGPDKVLVRVDPRCVVVGAGVGPASPLAHRLRRCPSSCTVSVLRRYFRPTEVDLLLGDPSKAKRELGWEIKVTFAALVKEMVDADVALLESPAHDPTERSTEV